MSMEDKLLSSVQSNSYKIVELYNKIVTGNLITGPYFQRKKFWKKQDKVYFIETILMNYPFPEVYIASQKLDLEKLTTTEMVVDGQQRLTTIVEYIQGAGDFTGKLSIKKFSELEDSVKKDFLNYPVSVKDLKNLEERAVKQVFQRINATDYSLNENEKLNATYGGGEFAYFSKQLTDLDVKVDKSLTNVVVPIEEREKVCSFFRKYNVFSNNDVNRMFDSQYIMLVASTILNGGYFGRSSKIISFLEEYNNEFENYSEILSHILNSISIIERLDFDPKSYWFNKANLFSLLVEFGKLEVQKINFNVLEAQLLELEKKVDLYFMAESEEDLTGIREEEKRYFEVARHGSHELAAREHRGEVIKEIVDKATRRDEPDIVQRNKKVLEEQNIDYAVIIPTETGLNKSIMDATSTVREFLKRNNVHNYDAQENGPNHKLKKDGYFVKTDGTESSTEISMYKSNGRGDCRIWFSGLKDFAEPNDELAVYVGNEVLKVLNLNK